ncbi:MAG: hypothetical protein V7749_17410 [Cocleimonas sp.]
MSITQRSKDLEDKIKLLLKKLPEESSTTKQLTNNQELYQDSVSYLLDKVHRVAFIGDVGVGKTTAICNVLGLLDNKKPILSTGSGRTTLCEVEIISGEVLKIQIEPHSKEEVLSYVNDFSLYLWSLKDKNISVSKSAGLDTFKLSSEVERALRNILGLLKSSEKDENGKRVRKDAARDFSDEFSTIENLTRELNTRVDFEQRSKVCFENHEDEDQNTWLHETFKSINNATRSDIGLAKRIVMTIPYSMFEGINFTLNVVDTKGVDSTVNRRDLDRCLTDDRTVSVICSSFNNAPNKSMVDLLKGAKESGLVDRIKSEIILLVLDRAGEAENIMGASDTVEDKEEGREVREEQIESDLLQKFNLSSLEIQFLDSFIDNIEGFKVRLAKKVESLRLKHMERLDEIELAVYEIEAEIQSQTAKEAKKQVKNTLAPWLDSAMQYTPSLNEFFLPLIKSISHTGTYAASIRASVNRRGEWLNLDYYQSLAYGARAQIVEQIDCLRNELVVLIDNMLSQNDLQPAYALLKQLKFTTEKYLDEIYQHVYAKGRAVYENELKNDSQLWNELYNQWGQGPGYKVRVAQDSNGWFQTKQYANYEQEVTNKATEGWNKYITEIRQLLGNF